MEEAAQAPHVSGDAEIRVVPAELPGEVDVLCGDWLVPMLAAPVSYAAERSTETTGRGLALDDGSSLAGLPPEPRESQHVEASSRWCRGRLPPAGSSEVQHSGLLRVQHQ